MTNSKIIILLIQIVILSASSSSDKSIEYVYSPLYLNELNPNDEKWIPLSIKVAKDN